MLKKWRQPHCKDKTRSVHLVGNHWKQVELVCEVLAGIHSRLFAHSLVSEKLQIVYFCVISNENSSFSLDWIHLDSLELLFHQID